MSVSVRAASPGDGAALASLHEEMGVSYAELAPQLFQRPDLDGLASELDSDLSQKSEDSLALVAEAGGDVVGALWAILVKPSAEAERQVDRGGLRPLLRISYVVTSPAHRRQGVGAQLVKEAEAWGRERRAAMVEVTTYRASPLSFPFWTDRMGFEERSVNLRKPLA